MIYPPEYNKKKIRQAKQVSMEDLEKTNFQVIKHITMLGTVYWPGSMDRPLPKSQQGSIWVVIDNCLTKEEASYKTVKCKEKYND